MQPLLLSLGGCMLCRHAVWLPLPLLSADWLSLPTCPSSAPPNFSLHAPLAPAPYLMLLDSTFQGPDSKFMGGRTLLARLGQQPSLVPLLWLGRSTAEGAILVPQRTTNILITQRSTHEELSGCQWPWPRSLLHPAAIPRTPLKSLNLPPCTPQL